MTDKELIQKILQAKRPLDIFDPGVKEIRKAYHEYAKIIHPDVCKEPKAQEAFLQLKEFYGWAVNHPSDSEMRQDYYGEKLMIRKALDISAFELGARYVTEDRIIYLLDSGKERFRDNYRTQVTGMLEKLNYIGTKKLKEVYIPLIPNLIKTFNTNDTKRLGIVLMKDPDEYPFDLFLKAYKDKIGGRDIAWMISRMIDLCCLCCFIRGNGYPVALNGFTDDNLCINPGAHSISIPGGWWYATPIGHTMIGTSKKVYSQMSSETRTTQLSTQLTDIECVRGICSRMVEGNPDVPKPILEWIRAGSTDDPLAEKKKWDIVLEKAYGPRRFVKLEVDPKLIYTQKRS